MKAIWSDFNNMSEDGRVRLNTLGSLEDLEQYQPEVGEEVWLVQEGDLRTKGIIELGDDGIYYGRPDWMTLEDWIRGKWILAPEDVRRSIERER